MCNICGDIYHIAEGEALFTMSHRERVQLNKDLSIDETLDKAINQLYDDRKIDDKTRKQLNKIHYEPLKKAVNEGFKPIIKVEYGTPNYEFLKQLQTNTAVFAVFKNHAAMKDMAALLKDKDGNLRSRDDFKKEALKVDSKYRGSKLDVEYDTAVRSARMAANWQKYVAKKKLYPNLRYVQTKAAVPDIQHLSYVGIVRPVEDAFWKTHYPPNRWRCQCSVEQTDDAATDIPDKLPPVHDDFAFNAGEKGQVFDLEKSDYIKSVPPKEQPALIKEAKKMAIDDELKSAEYQPVYSSRNGNKVTAHPGAFDNTDIDQVTKYARELANWKNGPRVTQVLPDLHKKELRKEILPDIKGSKNPDYRLDGTVFDLKVLSGDKPGKYTIQNQLSIAHGQGNGAVLIIPDNYQLPKYKLYKLINQKMRYDAYSDFELYLNYKGEWQYFTWADWQTFYAEKLK